MLLLKRPFCVCELQDLVLQNCFKNKLLIGPAAEVESSHRPIGPHQKHSARCCFLNKIYPYIRHTDGGFVDHLGSCHCQCSCLTPMFKPRDVPAVDAIVWSQTKRKTKKKNSISCWKQDVVPDQGYPSVSVFLLVIQVKVQHQQFGLLCSIPAASSTHQPRVGCSDTPHDTTCGETGKRLVDTEVNKLPVLGNYVK